MTYLQNTKWLIKTSITRFMMIILIQCSVNIISENKFLNNGIKKCYWNRYFYFYICKCQNENDIELTAFEHNYY